ncbi:MAG: biotin-dependent carboxyltransferase family protein [Rhodobacteraceae bacterium]|nr:biotin-dependent carboxyltransferase family protein [Paracoccaceae bacterium]
MAGLIVHRPGPACTVQDMGRPGYLEHGLSRGGAMDVQALAEGAALLGQAPELAALEMAGTGAEYEARGDLRIALTGAEMEATIDGAAVAWNASHPLREGQRLRIGAARAGSYGYLHMGGGIDSAPELGSRSAHLAAGIGRAIREGDLLPAGRDGGGRTGLALDVADRFCGGPVRIVESFQTGLFSGPVRERFAATAFARGRRANRMGVELAFQGEGFAAREQLNILSEVIVPGDIQMAGDGRPYVLMPECQATGGYPRIGTVIPCDLGIVAQAPPGAPLRFRLVGLEEAAAAQAAHEAALGQLSARLRPLVRDVADIPDLLSYQLIGGVISASDDRGDEQ